jgi:hypothetical protein
MTILCIVFLDVYQSRIINNLEGMNLDVKQIQWPFALLKLETSKACS